MNKQDAISTLLSISEDVGLETALFQQTAAGQAGLSVNDMRALSIIARSAAITAAELSRKLNVTNGAVSGITERLFAKRLITKNRAKDDSRKIQLSYNYKNRHGGSDIYEDIGAAYATLLESYSVPELELLIIYSEKVVALTKTQRLLTESK